MFFHSISKFCIKWIIQMKLLIYFIPFLAVKKRIMECMNLSVMMLDSMRSSSVWGRSVSVYIHKQVLQLTTPSPTTKDWHVSQVCTDCSVLLLARP